MYMYMTMLHTAYCILHTTYCIMYHVQCIMYTAYCIRICKYMNILHTAYCIWHTACRILYALCCTLYMYICVYMYVCKRKKIYMYICIHMCRKCICTIAEYPGTAIQNHVLEPALGPRRRARCKIPRKVLPPDWHLYLVEHCVIRLYSQG